MGYFSIISKDISTNCHKNSSRNFPKSSFEKPSVNSSKNCFFRSFSRSSFIKPSKANCGKSSKDFYRDCVWNYSRDFLDFFKDSFEVFPQIEILQKFSQIPLVIALTILTGIRLKISEGISPAISSGTLAWFLSVIQKGILSGVQIASEVPLNISPCIFSEICKNNSNLFADLSEGLTKITCYDIHWNLTRYFYFQKTSPRPSHLVWKRALLQKWLCFF